MASWDMFGGAWSGDPSSVPIHTMTQQPQPGQPGTVIGGAVDDLFGVLAQGVQTVGTLLDTLRGQAQIVANVPTQVPGWPTGWPTIQWPTAPTAAPAAAPASQDRTLLWVAVAVIAVLLLKG